MKKKLFLAGAAMMLAAAVVTGYTVCNAAPSDLFDANVEALTQDELPSGGTCCPSQNDTCKLELVTINGAYYKSDGPC